MIRRVYSKRQRIGWKYDPKRKQYFSWKFDIRLADGRRKREAGFLSEAEAQAVVARIRLAEKDLRYGFLAPKETPTFHELIDKHVTKLSPKESKRARRILEGLAKEAHDGVKVNELLTTHIDKFAERRRKQGCAPSTIDRDMNAISSALQSAADYFPQLKGWSVPKMPRPKNSKRRRERVINAGEIARLLTWLYQPQRKHESDARVINRRNVGHIFKMALATGARKGEICKLRWSQIDFVAGSIQMIGTKTEKRSSHSTVRYLQITPPIAEILNERLSVSRGDFVFTRAGGEATDYYEIIKEACEALGLPYGRDVIGGFTTHDARHTAVTRMLQAGCDLATIGSITGHQDKTLILRYGHATEESRERAMGVLEKLAENETFGLGLDKVGRKALIYSGNRNGMVPEVGLEPT